jgi:hypothetical protein
VTPVVELQGLGPDAIACGSEDQINQHLREVHRRWWDERRPALMVYANQHPSDRVRELANELATAFQRALMSTRYFLYSRKTAETMDDYHATEQRTQEALAKAEELMEQVRGRRSRFHCTNAAEKRCARSSRRLRARAVTDGPSRGFP